jgi:tRNA(Ile)-lysidine synthase
MPALGTLAAGGHELRIGRPLLTVSKVRLANALRARGVAWADDPTNLDPAYERPRLRAAADALQAAGLTHAALAESARRLRRARTALEALTHRFFDPTLGHAHVDPLGFVEISLEALRAEPEEISLRVLQATVSAVGGASEPLSLRALEELQQTLLAGSADVSCTLARAAIRRRRDRVHVEREPGREPLPTASLAPRRTLVWDGRFVVTSGDRVPPGAQVQALTAEGLAHAEALGLQRPASVAAQVLRALPAIWDRDGLIAVPSLKFSPRPEIQLDADLEFLGLRDLGGGYG